MDSNNFGIGVMWGTIAFVAFFAIVGIAWMRGSDNYQARSLACINAGGSWVHQSDFGGVCIVPGGPK